MLKEGYAATAPDLSSLVTKLRREGPDVILHTGYNPDITLFLRQSRELGLRWKALIGHGGARRRSRMRESATESPTARIRPETQTGEGPQRG